MEKLTVITVCYNAVAHIERMLCSVRAQSYPNIEHVVIDGGSTDGTLDVIERYRDGIAYFISEPDNGLYHAMNKGIKASSGDVLIFLNADDRFCDRRVLSDIVDVFCGYPELELVYGDVLRDMRKGTERWRQMEVPTRRALARTTICHQAIFARRELFDHFGGFNESFRIVADYEWLMRVYMEGARILHLQRDISIIGTEGLSHATSYGDEKRLAMADYYSSLEVFFWRALPRKWLPRIGQFVRGVLRFLKSLLERRSKQIKRNEGVTRR